MYSFASLTGDPSSWRGWVSRGAGSASFSQGPGDDGSGELGQWADGNTLHRVATGQALPRKEQGRGDETWTAPYRQTNGPAFQIKGTISLWHYCIVVVVVFSQYFFSNSIHKGDDRVGTLHLAPGQRLCTQCQLCGWRCRQLSRSFLLMHYSSLLHNITNTNT